MDRLLLRAANWIGDAIMTTPVIRAVRHNFPTARITILAKPWVVPVFLHNPNVDRILTYEDPGRHAHFLFGKIRLARDLRKHRSFSRPQPIRPVRHRDAAVRYCYRKSTSAGGRGVTDVDLQLRTRCRSFAHWPVS